MYNRFCLNFTIVTNKFFCNTFTQPVKYKFIASSFKFLVQSHVLATRGYFSTKTTNEVAEYYEEKYEKRLKNLLRRSDYKALYEKFNLEIEFLKLQTVKVPSTLTADNWLFLLDTKTRTERRTYLEFLWKVELKTKHSREKKRLKQMIHEMGDKKSTSIWNKNVMLLRIRNRQMNAFYQSRLINSILYEPILVFDLSYDKFMTPHEQANCGKQLLMSYASNRVHDSPFNFYFCNANKESRVLQKLHMSIPQLYEPDFPLTVTSQSYLDIFDKEKLVYLTPHTRNCMTTFDPNLIYIIGGLVDKVSPKPLSYQRARKQGIQVMKLPLSETLSWGTGSKKNLPINQVVSIMLDLKADNDWTTAFQHVPTRKLQESRKRQMEKKIIKRAALIHKLQ